MQSSAGTPWELMSAVKWFTLFPCTSTHAPYCEALFSSRTSDSYGGAHGSSCKHATARSAVASR